MTASAARVLTALERDGILLLQDPRLPNLCALVAGARVRGSWWGHQAGHAIFQAYNEVLDHSDVLAAKLIAGKVTFVHRRLWPALFVVGAARDPWQVRGLGAAARALLRTVDRHRQTRAHGVPAKELERRLLVHADQVHTDSGAHALVLRPWRAVARTRRCRWPRLSPAAARAAIEAAAASFGARAGTGVPLPWGRAP